MNNIFLAQIVGIVAIFFWLISIQSSKQYKILFLQAVANLIYGFEYILLGVIETAFMNFTSFIRCLLFYQKRKQDKDISNLYLILFSFLVILFGMITYSGYLSLIPIIITLFYTVSSWMKDSKWIRIVFLISAIMWIYYNYKVKAYVCIVGNIFEIISGALSLIRFKDDKNI